MQRKEIIVEGLIPKEGRRDKRDRESISGDG
jgi:hypothetical protein